MNNSVLILNPPYPAASHRAWHRSATFNGDFPSARADCLAMPAARRIASQLRQRPDRQE